MEIEMRDPSTLRPYSRNARVHSKKQVAQIAESIRRFGFTNPVLISDDDEIVAGHGRVSAAKLLGLREVPTVRLSHLSKTDQRAYVLADNKLALNAGWDPDLLAVEFEALIELEWDLDILGFATTEVDEVIGAAHERKVDRQDERDNQIPELPAVAVSRPHNVAALDLSC